ncbi:MAG TPA: MATE family efflux transporter, partial [Roseburia sp.]|nr:MATE family efflux transporter [Roseburia sp.]
MENKSLEQRMETEPVHRVILSLAAPTVLSMLVISAYSIVDTFFVTRLGSRATGAVGITFALVAWIQAVGYTVGMGAGSLVSRLLGKKEKEQAEQIANSAIMSGLLLGLISLGAGLIFLTPLLKLSGATTELLPYAREYALFVLLSAPFTIETLVLGTLLRAQGRAKASMAGMVTGGILDIILTPVFLFVLNLGVKGAALAAFIGQAVAAMVLGGCFRHGRMKLNGKKQSKNFFKIKDYGSIIKNGLPSLCRQGFASVAAVLLNRQAVGYGDAAVAAMSVDGRLFMVFFSLFIGYGQGFQPVAGFNYGARKYRRVQQACLFTMAASFCFLSVILTACWFNAETLIRLFRDDPEVTAVALPAFRYQCFA